MDPDVSDLRDRIGAMVGGTGPRPCLPTGVPALDRHLPGGGLLRGALHEMMGGGDDLRHGAAPAALAASLLGRDGRAVLWVMCRRDVFPVALAGAGLHPDRVVYVGTGREDDVLPAAEEGLRHDGLAGVVVEVGALPLRASRRLQLAAEGSGVLGIVIRRWAGGRMPDLDGTASATRWRLTPTRSAPLGDVPGVGAPRWRAELLRCRGGGPRSWVLEANLETGCLRVVADLADGQAAAAARGRAAA